MKKIIVLAACALLTNSVYAADSKAKLLVAKVEDKAAVSATVSTPARRAMKVSEPKFYDYSLERDGCCYTR